eukprot:scaffold577_cov405-Prasinococcus_capsulatus_cf.AAC.1
MLTSTGVLGVETGVGALDARLSAACLAYGLAPTSPAYFLFWPHPGHTHYTLACAVLCLHVLRLYSRAHMEYTSACWQEDCAGPSTEAADTCALRAPRGARRLAAASARSWPRLGASVQPCR